MKESSLQRSAVNCQIKCSARRLAVNSIWKLRKAGTLSRRSILILLARGSYKLPTLKSRRRRCFRPPRRKFRTARSVPLGSAILSTSEGLSGSIGTLTVVRAPITSMSVSGSASIHDSVMRTGITGTMLSQRLVPDFDSFSALVIPGSMRSDQALSRDRASESACRRSRWYPYAV